jgi:hypothetical protein
MPLLPKGRHNFENMFIITNKILPHALPRCVPEPKGGVPSFRYQYHIKCLCEDCFALDKTDGCDMIRSILVHNNEHEDQRSAMKQKDSGFTVEMHKGRIT